MSTQTATAIIVCLIVGVVMGWYAQRFKRTRNDLRATKALIPVLRRLLFRTFLAGSAIFFIFYVLASGAIRTKTDDEQPIIRDRPWPGRTTTEIRR